MYPGSPCMDISAVNASWQYGWWPRPARCQGIENVPMVACGADALKLIDSVGGLEIGGNSEWFMLFNEPDLMPQTTPGEGAILYWRLLPIIGGRKIVAPAPYELHIEWLPKFRQAYQNIYGEPPRLDALAAHCYMPTAAECEALVEQFIVWASKWQVSEVWVTEFSFMSLSEAHEFVDWMNSKREITRYAWFTNRLPALHVNDAPLVEWDTGRLTVWGEMYRGD